MANPVSLATIGIGSAIAGGATGAGGSILSGNSQANMYNYQAGVALANAQVAKQDAIYATQGGETSAQEAGLRGRAQMGGIRTGISAGNIGIGSGSGARVTSSQTGITQENEGIIRADAAKRAYGFNVSAAEDVAQAGADESAAKTSQITGYLGAASSIIGAAGSVSSKWLQANQYGIGSSNNVDIYGGGGE